MGQATDRIEQQIEATRTEMADTIQEISRRTDVPKRVKSAVQRCREKWFHGKEAATEAQAQSKQQFGRMQRMFRENPARNMASVFTAGVFVGMLVILRTRSRSNT